MYKHLTTVFLCRFMLAGVIFMPSVSMSADHCTNPKEYTVDKRCYVTDEQKKEKPYNAVVALYDDEWGEYCTGTIVKDPNGKPYLYTAKHCTGDENYMASSELTIKLQDGRKLSVTKLAVGDYNIEHDENMLGDWAIYSIVNSDVPMVEKSTKRGIDDYDITKREIDVYDARVVGYGSLKIMSDAEIAEFKSRYLTYLKDEKNIDAKGDENVYGFYRGGVNTYGNAYVTNFLDKEYDYWSSLTDDTSKLKLSHCKYGATGLKVECQGWGGNSGGPIFDGRGNIMAILTRSTRAIGGSIHAGSDSWFISGISLLEK
ncbi:MAG: hypothetical protein IKL37_03290 [Alphaproteobacteria bacterium]|nr:hypothetical protein [Alphaproteobacteria bacterium]